MRSLPSIPACLLAALSTLAAQSCGRDAAPPRAAERRVKVERPRAAEAGLRELPGVVREARASNVAFRVAGPVARAHVAQGDFVRQGDPMFDLDTRDYALLLDVAQAEYDKVLADTRRVSELHARGGVTDADYQKAVAGEKMVAAQLGHARDQLADTRLAAPFDGYVQAVNHHPGELVAVGMPVATLVDVSHFRVEVDVAAELFARRGELERARCLVAGCPDTLPLRLDGHDAAARASRLYRLTYRLEARPGVAPGAEARVLAHLPPRGEQPLTLPAQAVFERQGKACVWVYDPAAGTVAAREVRVGGFAAGGRINVAEGLGARELVVVAGVHALTDGERVAPIEPAAATNVGGLL